MVNVFVHVKSEFGVASLYVDSENVKSIGLLFAFVTVMGTVIIPIFSLYCAKLLADAIDILDRPSNFTLSKRHVPPVATNVGFPVCLN